MELRDYARVLRRRWLTVVLAVEAAVLAGVAATVLATPLYESTARLFVANPESTAGVGSTYQDSRFSQERVASYAQLVTGPRVAEAVIAQLQLPLTPAQLQGRVRARAIPDTVLVDVTATDSDPQQARRLTQALAEQFVRTVPELESTGGERLTVNLVVAEAAGPGIRTSPRPVRNVAISLLLGLLVGTGLALVLELLDDSVRRPEQLLAITGAEPLGVLPPPPPERKPAPGRRAHDPAAGRADALGWLAASVHVTAQTGGLRSLLLTGLDQHARDSTLAYELAVALAEAGGLDVVLVDADVRAAALSSRLGLQAEAGLAELLVADAGPESRDPSVLLHDVGGVRVLPAGRTAEAGPPSLRGLPAVLAAVEQCCELVVLSAPPLLTAAETVLVAARAQATILEVTAGRTKQDQLRKGLESLQRASGRLAGTVLTAGHPEPRQPTRRTPAHGTARSTIPAARQPADAVQPGRP